MRREGIMTRTVRLLTYKNLERDKGVPYTRRHIERLIGDRQFPAPVRIGPRRIAFIEAEIDAWIEQRAAERAAA
jgi:prophage regulatory protein